MLGHIFNIQRFSLDDGPGIRTTVFFKGCTLHCPWCHNPESILPAPQLMYYSERCIGCGRCVSACTRGARFVRDGQLVFERTKCNGCGRCVDACLNDALALCGYEMEAAALFCELLRDRAFYSQSGGGVTFSGGEAICQRDFLMEVAQMCHEHGIHTALDTAGNVPLEAFYKPLTEVIDIFLYDLKAVDEKLHTQLVGSDNKRILENLRFLNEIGARIWIRIPFIRGFNCSDEELESMATLIGSLRHVERIELMPYHGYGEGKYAALGLGLSCAGCTPSRVETAAAVEIFEKHGLHVLVSGG